MRPDTPAFYSASRPPFVLDRVLKPSGAMAIHALAWSALQFRHETFQNQLSENKLFRPDIAGTLRLLPQLLRLSLHSYQ